MISSILTGSLPSKNEGSKKIGTYDSNGQPKSVTTYFIGAVVNRRSDLPSGKIF